MSRGHPLGRRLLAEALGSALLAALVIGSGIAALQLSPGQTGLELLETAGATGAGLYALILMFGPVSGALDAWFRGLPWRHAGLYATVQVAGCVAGAVLANMMFQEPWISVSTKVRASAPHAVAEVVATTGLLLVIFALARTHRTAQVPAAVGAYIGAPYFFTSANSFANPAITVGRTFSDTFAGIAPSSAPVFIAAQLVGGTVGLLLVRSLYPEVSPAETHTVILNQVTARAEAARPSLSARGEEESW